MSLKAHICRRLHRIVNRAAWTVAPNKPADHWLWRCNQWLSDKWVAEYFAILTKIERIQR